MTAKLNIDLKQGLLHVEGTEEFVRAIYDDFKSRLTAAAALPPAEAASTVANNNNGGGKPETPRRTQAKTKSSRGDFVPAFNRELDTSKLAAYYNQFELKNHAEKILVFCMFLQEVLGMEKITGNDIFTCYTAMKAATKTPKAFPQALRDTEGKSFHYIEVKAWDDIVVPISGSNYFHHDLKRKETAE
jgi:hypothetical protein